MVRSISENRCVPAVSRWRITVTFPRPSKMLIIRSQGGGSMRSIAKLDFADELYFELVPMQVTSLGHASGAPSSLAAAGTLPAE